MEALISYLESSILSCEGTVPHLQKTCNLQRTETCASFGLWFY